jgi:predicted alpha/beta-fold hydrolase
VSLAGHWWTIAPALRDEWFPPRQPWTETLQVQVLDERFGPVVLDCPSVAPEDATEVAVLVHGLGGCAGSGYVVRLAGELAARGIAAVALQRRGADGSGSGLYHAAHTDDLEALLQHDALQSFGRVHLVGFSLGGHLCLHAARKPLPGRVASTSALCAPLDIAAVQTHMDRPAQWPYRRHVLRGMQAHFRAVVQRHGLPVDLRTIDHCTSFRAFDAMSVVQRFGFRDVDHYYDTVCLEGHLHELRIPSLLVCALGDPMVRPAAGLPRAALPAGSMLRVVTTAQGGHLGFPRDLQLGTGNECGLAAQLVSWWSGLVD